MTQRDREGETYGKRERKGEKREESLAGGGWRLSGWLGGVASGDVRGWRRSGVGWD